MKIDRYKQGYISDEWGMNSHLGLIKDVEGNVCKFSDVQKILTAHQWQPIETAPKDGTSILLYGGDWIFEGRFSDGGWVHAYENDDTPTHWMPLPQLPGDEKL